jgi:prepilin-type N-terminal cleavage/methylation domain-containing protein
MSERNGFTLVELLAALFASSLLLVGIGWALSGVRAEYERSEVDRMLVQVESTRPLIEHLIQAMQPSDRSTPLPILSRDHLSFRSSPPLALAAMGQVIVDLSVRSDARGQSLTLRLTSADAGAARLASNSIEQDLLQNTADIAFSVEQPAQFERPTLPRLVNVTVTAPNQKTYTISATPRLNASGSCRFDPISLSCRY